MTDTILCSIEDRIATLTLNRPEKRNALSAELISTLLAQLRQLQTHPDVGAIILAAAGDKAFCAGADLGPPQGDGFLNMHNARRDFADLLTALMQSSKPVVAAVNGHALAGGLGLVCACDFAVVRRDARYGTPEIKRGLFPMMIAAVLLRTLGRRRTYELCLTGVEINGEVLERWGGCNAAVDADDVMPRARQLAASLASHSPAILALGKQALVHAEDMTLAQQLEYLRSQMSLNTLAEDAAIGVQAFFSKTTPQWVGR